MVLSFTNMPVESNSRLGFFGCERRKKRIQRLGRHHSRLLRESIARAYSVCLTFRFKSPSFFLLLALERKPFILYTYV